MNLTSPPFMVSPLLIGACLLGSVFTSRAPLQPDAAAHYSPANAAEHYLFGSVSDTGKRMTGTGFKARKTATGTYEVVFETPFSNPPMVVVTPQTKSNYRFFTRVQAKTSKGFTVVIQNFEGYLQPGEVGFDFMVTDGGLDHLSSAHIAKSRSSVAAKDGVYAIEFEDDFSYAPAVLATINTDSDYRFFARVQDKSPSGCTVVIQNFEGHNSPQDLELVVLGESQEVWNHAPSIISGSVSNAGRVTGGANFTAKQTSPGRYEIKFDDSFQSSPTVLVTLNTESDYRFFARIQGKTAKGFTMVVQNYEGYPQSGSVAFDFIAMGN